MTIEHCKRCEQDWCFRGTGRPVRCGRCKSPYWDKEKRDADKAGVGDGGRGQVDGAVRAGLAGGGQGKRSEDNRKARKGGAGNLTVRGPDTAGDAPVSSTNCPSCGALNGIHQRGCKG